MGLGDFFNNFLDGLKKIFTRPTKAELEETTARVVTQYWCNKNPLQKDTGPQCWLNQCPKSEACDTVILEANGQNYEFPSHFFRETANVVNKAGEIVFQAAETMYEASIPYSSLIPNNDQQKNCDETNAVSIAIQAVNTVLICAMFVGGAVALRKIYNNTKPDRVAMHDDQPNTQLQQASAINGNQSIV